MKISRGRGARLRIGLAALVLGLAAACAAEVDIEKLFVQSNSDDYEERVEARKKLADLVRTGEVEPFVRGLRSEAGQTRVQSIFHLMLIDRPAAKEALAGELALDRRFNAYYNPIRLVPVSIPSDSRIMIAHILRARGGYPKAAAILAGSYGHEPDTATRVATIYALGALNDPGAVPALNRALRDADLPVVRAALEGLSQMEVPGVAGQLLAGLADPDERIRANCAAALAGFPGAESTKKLEGLIRSDQSEKVREAAVLSLPHVGGADSFEPLVGLLRHPETPPPLKDKIGQALRSLTNQDFGSDPAKWSRWWAENRRQVGAAPR